jgi:hypothetical protein
MRKRSEPLAFQGERIGLFIPKVATKPKKSERSDNNNNNSTNSQSQDKNNHKMIDNFFKIDRKTPIYSQLKLKSRGNPSSKDTEFDNYCNNNTIPMNINQKTNFPKEKFLAVMLNKHHLENN